MKKKRRVLSREIRILQIISGKMGRKIFIKKNQELYIVIDREREVKLKSDKNGNLNIIFNREYMDERTLLKLAEGYPKTDLPNWMRKRID